MNVVCSRQKGGHVERQLAEQLSVAYGLRFKFSLEKGLRKHGD